MSQRTGFSASQTSGWESMISKSLCRELEQSAVISDISLKKNSGA